MEGVRRCSGGCRAKGEAAADAVLREGGGAASVGGREAGRAFRSARWRASRSIARTHPRLPGLHVVRAGVAHAGETCVYPASGSSKANGPLRKRARGRARADGVQPLGTGGRRGVVRRRGANGAARDDARRARDATRPPGERGADSQRGRTWWRSPSRPRAWSAAMPTKPPRGCQRAGKDNGVPNGRPASAISAAVKICERRDDPTLMRIITGAINSRRTGKKNHAFEKQNASPS